MLEPNGYGCACAKHAVAVFDLIVCSSRNVVHCDWSVGVVAVAVASGCCVRVLRGVSLSYSRVCCLFVCWVGLHWRRYVAIRKWNGASRIVGAMLRHRCAHKSNRRSTNLRAVEPRVKRTAHRPCPNDTPDKPCDGDNLGV